MQVVDVQGRSGATYRFRHAPSSAELPAHAGNFILVEPSAGRPKVLACGTRGSLIELAGPWGDLTAGGAEIYIRLNVSRATRQAEHDDLVAQLAPAQLLPEAD
jgi:hypothetical protein